MFRRACRPTRIPDAPLLDGARVDGHRLGSGELPPVSDPVQWHAETHELLLKSDSSGYSKCRGSCAAAHLPIRARSSSPGGAPRRHSFSAEKEASLVRVVRQKNWAGWQLFFHMPTEPLKDCSPHPAIPFDTRHGSSGDCFARLS